MELADAWAWRAGAQRSSIAEKRGSERRTREKVGKDTKTAPVL
jgi:hypothetical protein